MTDSRRSSIRQGLLAIIPTHFLSWIKKFGISSQKLLRVTIVLESPRVAALCKNLAATNGIGRATSRVVNLPFTPLRLKMD
jgi:hypothetical protein